MKKIKVFIGHNETTERKIEEWIKEMNPNILEHTSGVLYPSTWSYLYVTILYEESLK